jgi:hypothetical protein
MVSQPCSFEMPDGLRCERELRELVRYRCTLVRERTSELNRIAKILEGANIKLASLASEIGGVSSRAIIAALVAGETDPAAMAELAGPLERQARGPHGRSHGFDRAAISASSWA